MRKVYIIILFLCWAFASQVFAEDAKCHRSTEGTEFWFGFMEGRNYVYNIHYIEITVTAAEATSFSVFTGKSTVAFYTGNVPANGSVQIEIPLELGEATGSETIQEKGIHLVAEKPVNLYALNWDRNSADVAVMYPVESLGKEYLTMCFTPHVDDDVEHGRNSEFLVVASEDNTWVEITPSVVTDRGKSAGVPFNVTLHKGEVFQVQSANQRNLAGQGDLTGSYIKSDKPVAVYSGNFSTTVPVESRAAGFDHLFEQVPPIHTWGREFFTVPLLTRRMDRYRVMASEDSTTIQIGNDLPIIKNRGEYEEFILFYDQPSHIIADKPIMLAQFSQSNSTDDEFTGGEGDPFMIILSPVSQSKNEAIFVAYNSNQIRDYYINLVALTSEKDNIELDGNRMGNLFKAYPGTNYSYVQIKTFPGTHTLKNLNPDRGFLAYVYGYGGYESYGYGVGFNLDLILDLGQGINFDGDTIPICFGQSIVLDAGPYFDSYSWNTGETTQKITVSGQNKYWATGTTTDGCLRSDTIYVLVSNPVKPDIGKDEQGCGLHLQLDAGAGYAKYSWNTGETTQIIEAGTTGMYAVNAYDKYGCYRSDTMNLTVFPVPLISMKGETQICGLKSHALELQFENANETMIANGQMHWETNNQSKLFFSNQTKISTDIEVTEWGEYEVSYTFTTPDNCVVSDTFILVFADTPTSLIEFADDTNDKCKGYSREIRYNGNATSNANFYWDFDGSHSDSLDWNLRRVSRGVYTSNPVVTLVVEENGCMSDTSRLEIGANPDFTMNTVKGHGCDSATIQFSGEIKTADDLIFEWNFGDGSPISKLQNPTHFYVDTGKYNVGLLLTNQLSGCKAGYTMEEMVNIFPTPVATIVVDSEFCNDKTVEVHYLQNTDFSICAWEFDGATKIGTGNDSIAVLLDKQIATIRLQSEENGCKSEWAEATAKRKPIFDFSPNPTEGCEPLQILASASTADEGIEFKWLRDMNTDGTEAYFTFPDAGNYDLSLAAFSSITGCSDTLVKNDFVEVHPKPEAKFTVDFPVAIIEHANLQFTGLTPGADIFKWDFKDGFHSSEKNPQHTYTQLGTFPVELIVESEFGCIDTAWMEIEILPFNVYTPNAFRPDSEISENREFMPVGIGVDPNRFQLQIYNRWGELIFESKSPDYKWDGTTKNSTPAPMGNYIWKADFNDIQGFQHSMKGQVLLIR